jgi:hypothetical protein
MILMRSSRQRRRPDNKFLWFAHGVLADRRFAVGRQFMNPTIARRRSIAARNDTTLTPLRVQHPATAGNRETRDFPK